ncbi:hypothetical protein ACFLSI_01900 [Bacteroidota bacterium]
MHEKFKYKNTEELQKKAAELNLQLPFSDETELLFQPLFISNKKVPNRLVVQPMEGFDSENNGSPGKYTIRRYKRYAEGGSGMIWFEATSVTQDGRSNPHQLLLNRETLAQFKSIVEITKKSAINKLGNSHEPFLVLQLTHSGRYSKPDGNPVGKVLCFNPYLDKNRENIILYKDEEIENIQHAYNEAIILAKQAGFDAVDIKACHGYLLHEMLGAFNRTDSKFGGNFEKRIAFLTDLINHDDELILSVRLNATDLIPYPYGFGMKNDRSVDYDLEEPKKLIKILINKGSQLMNITAGVPYYNTHIGRPFDRPVKGSIFPVEHPLEGIMRMVNITSELQKEFPDIPFVGTGYSWLQQFFPNVGAGVIKNKMASLIGLGRSAFAYPDAPLDLMQKGRLDKKKTCIACSRCTELMRSGNNSGCVIQDKEIYGKLYKRSVIGNR